MEKNIGIKKYTGKVRNILISLFDFKVLSFAKNGEKAVKYYMLKQNHEWVWNQHWTCNAFNQTRGIKRSWNQDAGTHWSIMEHFKQMQ